MGAHQLPCCQRHDIADLGLALDAPGTPQLLSNVDIFCAFGVLYGASTSLPGLLQSLFGYDAYVSGLVQSPSGVFSIAMMVVGGILLGRGTDARWLIGAGLLVMAAGCYWSSWCC